MYHKLKHTVITLVSFSFLVLSTDSMAQKLRCGTMERFEYESKENNALLLQRNSISKALKQWKKNIFNL